MSLINDALKRARQTPPPAVAAPLPMPTPHSVTPSPVSAAGWLIPAVVIFLVVAGLFFVGWAVAGHSVSRQNAAAAPAPAPAVVASATPPAAKPVPLPATAPKPAAPAPAPVVNPPAAPRLQGIFYSPTAPSAIVDGQTVRPGDQLLSYRVVEITKLSVTLAAADGKTVKLTMSR